MWQALGLAYAVTVAVHTIAQAVATGAEIAWAMGIKVLRLIWSVLAMFGEPRRVSMWILGLAVILCALGDRGSEDEDKSSA